MLPLKQQVCERVIINFICILHVASVCNQQARRALEHGQRLRTSGELLSYQLLHPHKPLLVRRTAFKSMSFARHAQQLHVCHLNIADPAAAPARSTRARALPRAIIVDMPATLPGDPAQIGARTGTQHVQFRYVAALTYCFCDAQCTSQT